MNGFQLLSDSYKKALSLGEISREEAEKKCRVFDFLATCDQDDFYNLFDSSAFNEISKSYMRLAVRLMKIRARLSGTDSAYFLMKSSLKKYVRDNGWKPWKNIIGNIC